MLDKIDLSKKIDKKTYKKWDAAGKGTSIQKLTSPIDPRGYKLYPIRAARTYEKKYPWLWRFWLKTPARGEWAIFDRSWYGRVMVERVENLIPEKEWRRAYRDITEFERTLADDGTLIIKFFLHISKQEQKRRFEKLSKDPLSAWHVTPEDWEHHSHYDDWLVAYEEALERTDTEWGPWTIVEATDRRHTWVKIYRTVIDLLTEHFGLEFAPDSDDEEEVVLEDNSADEEEAEQEEDAFNEPSGEDSDDENPYDIDTEKLETALAANELKIEDLTNGWILEETEPEPEQEPEKEPEN